MRTGTASSSLTTTSTPTRTGRVTHETKTKTTRTTPGAEITGMETAAPGITAAMVMGTATPGITGMVTGIMATAVPETTGIPGTAATERGKAIQEIPEIAATMETVTETPVITATTRKTARAKARTTQATATRPMRKSITARTRAASCSR